MAAALNAVVTEGGCVMPGWDGTGDGVWNQKSLLGTWNSDKL